MGTDYWMTVDGRHQKVSYEEHLRGVSDYYRGRLDCFCGAPAKQFDSEQYNIGYAEEYERGAIKDGQDTRERIYDGSGKDSEL